MQAALRPQHLWQEPKVQNLEESLEVSLCGCQAGRPGPQSLRGWEQLSLGHCREVGGRSEPLREETRS